VKIKLIPKSGPNHHSQLSPDRWTMGRYYRRQQLCSINRSVYRRDFL